MTTLKQFLAELSYIQIKEISRHAKGLLIAIEKSNRKKMLEYTIKPQKFDDFEEEFIKWIKEKPELAEKAIREVMKK